MDVVDPDHERSVLRDPLEQPAHRPSRFLGLGRAGRQADRLEHQAHSGVVALEQLTKSFGRIGAAELADDVREGSVGDVLAVREAAADHNGGGLTYLHSQLSREPGLAEPSGADDGDHAALGHRAATGEHGMKLAQLALATYERRRASGEVRGFVDELDHPPGPHLRSAALRPPTARGARQ